MLHLRTFLGNHRRLAFLLVALALAMKAMVPAGYMVNVQARVLTVLVCADASDGGHAKQIAIPVDEKSDGGRDNGKIDHACPYSALAMASLHGADALLLGFALAFILALAFAPTQFPRLGTARHLRPPLRGPPTLACPLLH